MAAPIEIELQNQKQSVIKPTWSEICESVSVSSGPNTVASIFELAKQAIWSGDYISSIILFATALKKAIIIKLKAKKDSAADSSHSPHQQAHRSSSRSLHNPLSSAKEVSNCIDLRKFHLNYVEYLCIAFDSISQQLEQSGDIDASPKTEDELESAIQVIVDSLIEISSRSKEYLINFDLKETSIKVLARAASLMLCLDRQYEALQVAQRAVSLMPESHVAQETFENLCCHLVERWHFIMLNDKSRNQAYQQAIESVLESSSKELIVCDIGSGTGLLSFIAASQKMCSKVYAIDCSVVMCKIAEELIKSPEASQSAVNKITVVNKMSSDMSVPEDMPFKADVLVTEIFDAGLFGEGILPTLCHAWSSLLKSSDSPVKAKVIPQGACLYVQPVQADYIQRENRYNIANSSCGLNLSNVTICSSVGMCYADPYTTYDLSHLPGGYKPLSAPSKCMEVNFNNIEEIGQLNQGSAESFTLDITQDGRLDALVVWFDLDLCEGVKISTHPESGGCWDQAVFPVSSVRLSEERSSGQESSVTLNVESGDQLSVHRQVKVSRFHMCVTDIARKAHSETFDKPPSDPFQIYQDESAWCRQGVFCLSTAEVARLNDDKLHTVLLETVKDNVRDRVGAGASVVDFVHLNNGFSTLCLEALQEGCHRAVTHVVSPSVQQALLAQIATTNGIDLQRLIMVDSSEELINTDVLSHNPFSNTSLVQRALQRETALGPTSLTGKSYSSTTPAVIVACDFVDFEGRLAEGLSEQFAVLRSCLHGYSQVIPVPARVEVHGVLVESEELLCLSRIQSDENTLGFHIGECLNRFSTKNHQGISLDTLSHAKLSEPFKMFTIDVGQLLGVATTLNTLSTPQSVEVSPEEKASTPITSLVNEVTECEPSEEKMSSKFDHMTAKMVNLSDSGATLCSGGQGKSSSIQNKNSNSTSPSHNAQDSVCKESSTPSTSLPSSHTNSSLQSSLAQISDVSQRPLSDGPVSTLSVKSSRPETEYLQESQTDPSLHKEFPVKSVHEEECNVENQHKKRKRSEEGSEPSSHQVVERCAERVVETCAESEDKTSSEDDSEEDSSTEEDSEEDTSSDEDGSREVEENSESPLNQSQQIKVPVTSSGKITALVYWFDLKFPQLPSAECRSQGRQSVKHSGPGVSATSTEAEREPVTHCESADQNELSVSMRISDSDLCLDGAGDSSKETSDTSVEKLRAQHSAQNGSSACSLEDSHNGLLSADHAGSLSDKQYRTTDACSEGLLKSTESVQALETELTMQQQLPSPRHYLKSSVDEPVHIIGHGFPSVVNSPDSNIPTDTQQEVLTVTTLDPCHYWQQAAVMMTSPDRQAVCQGQVLTLHCRLSESAISVSRLS